MWIVRLALRRPYTFVVCSLILMLLSTIIILRMPKDIFPPIDIPVVTVIWSYNGMAPDEMEKRLVTISERAMTTTVNDIEHIESQTLGGVAVIKVFFQPHAKIEAAVAQVTAISQTILRIFPPGTTPPFIIRYSASNVPVLQLGLESEELSEQQIYDLATNFIRTRMATVQGASVPLPYGGKQKQIQVDLDLQALTSLGIAPLEVSTAINAQNLILPAGTVKMGTREYNVRLNSSPELAAALNDIPIKTVRGATIYLRDVAQVREGYAPQVNVVRKNGNRSALLTILKNGTASTLEVVDRMKALIPEIQKTMPKSLKMEYLLDQSLFVRASLDGVLREGVIAAGLTAAMILLFLGSWRSTLIVAISIPLSVLVSIVTLSFLGETLNIMTLGGLALAVGILVDDTTVEIENIHRNLAMGKEINRAILDGAQQIAMPAFVSTLAICIVFAPVFFLSGAAKYLFTPLAEAVVFAMLASYLVSRTIVPTLVKYLLQAELHLYQHPEQEEEMAHQSRNPIWRAHYYFNLGFEALRRRYTAALGWVLHHRLWASAAFVLFVGLSLGLFPLIGQDFFPTVDAGQFRLHVRSATGTRIEETERIFNQVERELRRIIPAQEIATIIDNLGVSPGGVNLAFSDSSTVSAADGEIMVALKAERKGTTEGYMRRIRRELPAKFPALSFYFQPADIVTQILNFGLPAPIDVQVVGRNPGNVALAKELEKRMGRISGMVDVHLHQLLDGPEYLVRADRAREIEMGLTQRDVAGNLLISLSGSGQTAPNYWIDPKNGVNYSIAVQTPQNRINSLADLEATPILAPGQSQPQMLSNLAVIQRRTAPMVINHYNVQPVYDIYATTQGRDLGAVAADLDTVIAGLRSEKKIPEGTQVTIRGQVASMRTSFSGLAWGLLIAVILVYFLMVINFQSWGDPLIIAMALPGALAGILWALFLTRTTFNVPSLMGAIMSIGVATANSILLVTFANERRRDGLDAMTAALEAGFTRLRPVMMTALAMIIGMLPMAIGAGEGGEQNAPLGRAVIGGLTVATFATLFFVPIIYTLLRRKALPEPEVIPD